MGEMGPQDLTALCAFGFHSNGSCIKIQACCKKKILEIYLHTKNCPLKNIQFSVQKINNILYNILLLFGWNDSRGPFFVRC